MYIFVVYIHKAVKYKWKYLSVQVFCQLYAQHTTHCYIITLRVLDDWSLHCCEIQFCEIPTKKVMVYKKNLFKQHLKNVFR